MSVAARLLIAAIDRYRAAGGGKRLLLVDCNFEPSCSLYARAAIQRFGAARGVAMAWRRLRRCTDRTRVDKIHDPVPAAD
jgi:putative component of membrane protein insertase Oxa1/YidC/SpoIIIJ protein YidD